jgi:hypothetical protein
MFGPPHPDSLGPKGENGSGGTDVQNNFHWYQMLAYEKITEVRRTAARDRLALAATQATRGVQRRERTPVAKLLWALAGVVGLGGPTLLRE